MNDLLASIIGIGVTTLLLLMFVGVVAFYDWVERVTGWADIEAPKNEERRA